MAKHQLNTPTFGDMPFELIIEEVKTPKIVKQHHRDARVMMPDLNEQAFYLDESYHPNSHYDDMGDAFWSAETESFEPTMASQSVVTEQTIIKPAKFHSNTPLETKKPESHKVNGAAQSDDPSDQQSPKDSPLNTVIKVIGVGGAGCNAVDYITHSTDIKHIELIAVNSDEQTLLNKSADRKIKLGDKGLGAGGDPVIGRRFAEEQEAQIRQHLEDTHMIFLSTSMGGGTGTGASPVIAKIASDMSILVVSVVYMPYDWEGKTEMANQGLEELQKYTDALIVLPNENLEYVEADDIDAQMARAHQVLADSITGIYEVLANHGMVNADFNDLKTACRFRGRALIGKGEASGKNDNRADTAVAEALENPLMDIQMFTHAKSMLINIKGRFGKQEIGHVKALLSNYVQEDRVKICLMPDSSMEDKLQIILIATGISCDPAEPKVSTTIEEEQVQEPAAPKKDVIPLSENKPNLRNRMDTKTWTNPRDMYQQPTLMRKQLD